MSRHKIPSRSTCSRKHCKLFSCKFLQENPFEALKTQKQVWGTSYLDSLRAGHIWRGRVGGLVSRNLWEPVYLLAPYGGFHKWGYPQMDGS